MVENDDNKKSRKMITKNCQGNMTKNTGNRSAKFSENYLSNKLTAWAAGAGDTDKSK